MSINIDSLPASPNQVTIDQIRVKLNEIITAANEGTIAGGNIFNYTLLENGSKILLEQGGGVLLESSSGLSEFITEATEEILITEDTADNLVVETQPDSKTFKLENGSDLLLEDLVTTLDLELATSTAKNVVVESATPTADIPSNYSLSFSRQITSGSVVPYKVFPLNRGSDLKWVILYTVPLPKPAGFTAGSGSVGVEVDWNHVGNTLSSDPNNGGVYKYSDSGIAQTITMDNGDISKSFYNTATSNISGVPSVFSKGHLFHPSSSGGGTYTDVANAKITYTHPYGLLWYATSGTYNAGRTSFSALGKLILLPFYDYENDTPAMAYIGDGAYGKNNHSWSMHYYITRNQANFAAPNACWLGRSVTLHPGGDDPHWNHTQYGVTQRNPGGYA